MLLARREYCQGGRIKMEYEGRVWSNHLRIHVRLDVFGILNVSNQFAIMMNPDLFYFSPIYC